MGTACALVLAIAGVVASSAYASGFGVERYDLEAVEAGGSADTQAGSHPHTLTVEAVLDQDADDTSEGAVRNLTFELPPGLILDPRAVAQEEVVGEAQLSIGGKLVSAPISDLRPAVGELGRLGFTIESIPLFVGIANRVGSNHGVDAGDEAMTLTLHNIPQLLSVESVKLSLTGSSPSLVTLPTSCSDSTQTTIQAESWGAQTASLSAPFQQLGGCEELAFSPALSVTPEVEAASEPSGYTLRLTVPESEAPLVASQLRDASVTLPEGVSVSLSATNGLSGCSEAQFMPGSGEQEICPTSAKVGVVALHTPLLGEPLEGAVFLATPHSNPFGALIALYVEAEEPLSGARVEFAGEMTLDPRTGRATLRFDGLPQFPIDVIELRLFGGERSLLANPRICGTDTAIAELVPWSGGPAANVESSFEITVGADGGPCLTPAPFAPRVRLEPTTVVAGASGPVVLAVSRTSAEQNLSIFSLRLPAGVTWNFADVSVCPEPAARAAACPAASEVGKAILRVGPIPGLAWFTGQVYLTEAYGGGEYGLSIAFDATAGPFELGEVVVRAAIVRDPSTGALTVVSDPLPQALDGIPLQTHALELDIERAGLVVFPTLCEPRRIGATVESVEGVTAEASSAFNVEGCRNQPAPPGGSGGGETDTGPKPHATSAHPISHIHYSFSRGHLLLTFKLLAGGKVTIAGQAVHRYVGTLGAGAQRVKLALSNAGRLDMRHHRRFALKLALHAPGGPAGGYISNVTVERTTGGAARARNR